MMRIKKYILPASLLAVTASLVCAQTSELAPVISKPVSQTVDLPAEILPFLNVSLHAKEPGYVEQVRVDRGSVVDKGELLIELSAPEMDAQIAEGESKVPTSGLKRPPRRPVPWPETTWFKHRSRSKPHRLSSGPGNGRALRRSRR